MKNVIWILLLGTMFSCTKTEIISNNHQEKTKIVPIKDDKKMVKIDGGSYKPFIGRDPLVTVKPFLMDETAVTNAEYLKFLKANPQWTRSKVLRLYADSTYLAKWKGDYELPDGVSPEGPVTNVSWFAATAFAKSVGKRLPTVAEWEFVARADETNKNAADSEAFTNKILKLYERRGMFKNPVKQVEPNVWGVYDMFGVIWEWTDDFNSIMTASDARGDESGNQNLFCAGGAATTEDLKNYAAFVRYAMRGSLKANYTVNNLGFRCVKDL